MKRRILIVLLSLFAAVATGTAVAEPGYADVDRFAFGIGLGLVDVSNALTTDTTETYLTANFRILLGDKDAKKDEQTVVAYVEPEIGYWERDVRIPLRAGQTASGSTSDTLVGVNIIGVVPFRRVDYYFGAGVGIHFFDVGLNADAIDLGSDETFGVNAQVGLDVRITESIGVFGMLRLDLIEEVKGAVLGEEQAKIALGLRFFFG